MMTHCHPFRWQAGVLTTLHALICLTQPFSLPPY